MTSDWDWLDTISACSCSAMPVYRSELILLAEVNWTRGRSEVAGKLKFDESHTTIATSNASIESSTASLCKVMT